MKILISAGDPSGDILASLMARELRRLRPGIEIWALGGPELKKIADVFLEDLTHLGLMGWMEPLRRIPYFWKLRRRLGEILAKVKFDAVVPVDYYGFNIHVAAMAKRRKLPVIYYVSPQVWASRQYRANKIRRFVDRVLCLYPFEPAFYARYGVDAKFVGHPMTESLSPKDTKGNGSPAVGLLPGSRPGEIRRHLPVLLKVWKRLKTECPDARAFLYYREDMKELYTGVNSGIEMRPGPDYEHRANLDLALSSSGMATLEHTFLGVPQVAFYAVSPAWVLSILKYFVSTPYMSLPNVLAGRLIVPEKAWGSPSGDECAAAWIGDQASIFLKDGAKRNEMRRALLDLAASLKTSRNPSTVAAEEVAAFL